MICTAFFPGQGAQHPGMGQSLYDNSTATSSYRVLKGLEGETDPTKFQVALPDCIPSIIAGLKTAMSIAWMCVVAAEMIVSRAGVGFLINRGMENSDTALVMVSMVVIAAVSATITFILNKLEEVLCPWLTIGK